MNSQFFKAYVEIPSFFRPDLEKKETQTTVFSQFISLAQYLLFK